MKKVFLKTIGAAALTIFALAAFGQIQISGQDFDQTETALDELLAGNSGGGRLEGTWNVLLTIRNCDTGAAGPTIRELITFNAGGTLIASTSGLPPSVKTPGHGVWSHETGHTYKYSFKFFRFDAAGVFIGSAIVRQTLSLNAKANEYESAGTISFYNTNDEPVPVPPGGCSTTTAVRFE